MNILTKNINKTTFEEVASFCGEQIIEGVELDYKKDKPKDLSKHFAAFSNTLGGIIIIGVEENSATGLPKKWEGISNDSKHIDWVHQMASSVVPLPSYEVALTNEVNGKVFLLIRIFEGPATPYTTQSDPTVWVRTGNISTSLKSANREDLLQLVSKSQGAYSSRFNMDQMIKRHVSAITAREKSKQSKPGDPTASLGIVEVHLMPYNPVATLFKLRDYLGIKAGDLVGTNGNPLYALAANASPIPYGLASARFGNARHQSLQIYDNGTLFLSEGIAMLTDSFLSSGQRAHIIYIAHIFDVLVKVVVASRKLLNEVNYHGLVRGKLTIGSIKDLTIMRMSSGGYFIPDEDNKALLDSYTWNIELDTRVLNNTGDLREYLVELCEQIHWNLGDSGPGREAIESFLMKRTDL